MRAIMILRNIQMSQGDSGLVLNILTEQTKGLGCVVRAHSELSNFKYELKIFSLMILMALGN